MSRPGISFIAVLRPLFFTKLKICLATLFCTIGFFKASEVPYVAPANTVPTTLPVAMFKPTLPNPPILRVLDVKPSKNFVVLLFFNIERILLFLGTFFTFGFHVSEIGSYSASVALVASPYLPKVSSRLYHSPLLICFKFFLF